MYTKYMYKLIYTYSFIVIYIYIYIYIFICIIYTNIFIMRYIKLDLKINKSMSC